MLNRCLITSLLCVVCVHIFANNYEDAWKALNRNDRKAALQYLQKAMNDPATAADAYITYNYISKFDGTESSADNFISKVYDKLPDPSAYVYAMWMNKAVLGTYGKKTSLQESLLDKIFTDGKCNGSLQSAAHYMQLWNFLGANNLDAAMPEAEKMGAAGPLWQLAGPFDNISGSGFDKDYGPLKHPESTAVFKSLTNADIQWFTPSIMNKDGWTFPYAHIRHNTAVMYAQLFVNVPEDMKVLLNAGCNGALKVWVNDEEIIAEPKELVTELDYYKNYVQLKKGYNRLLVQLSYTSNSFPNFIIRFTDDKFNSVQGLTYTAALQQYTKGDTTKHAQSSIRHFAEAFFENKIQQQPDNLINYILLCETYLRNKNTSMARGLIEDAVERYPDNSLLRYELLSCYLKEDNNTLLTQEIERMKEKYPDCILGARLNIQQLMESEKYDEADAAIKKYDSMFNDKEDYMLNTKVRIYSKQNRMDDLISLIENSYKKNPDNPDAVKLMFAVKTNVNKDTKAALEVYENFLKTNWNFDIIKALADEYKKQGMPDKELEVLNYISKISPYDPDLLTNVANYYFDQQNYTKGVELARQVLLLAPYVSTYWENLGVQLQQQHQDSEAINAFKKAVYLNANNYSAREDLRTIQKKPSIWKAFPETDVYQVIKNSTSDTIKDYDYYYLLDQKYAVIYPEGACEESYTYVIKILTEKGIDDYKETSLSYNENSSYLIIDKAETVKSNGVKTPAEQNDNQMVFTNLEVGDVIVIQYRIQNYFQGRLAKDYWDKFVFNSFVPEKLSRFCLLVADDIKINTSALNTNIQPAISSYDNFKLYNWQIENSSPLEDESFMPPLGDVGASVTISTLNSWDDIAEWYSDLAENKTNDDYEVKKVYHKLFPKGITGLSQKTIADTIYTYIAKNIRYSSVSFRQSNYTPQKPFVTINTGLGDCKDVSSLFVALTRMAGIKSNLVLVNTRDYGKNTMPLPSVEFNHCIAKAELDGVAYYIELTDNTLPFLSLPGTLYQASSLFIPDNSTNATGAKLESIGTTNSTPDKVIRATDITIDSNNVHITADVTKTGALTSDLRYKYASLSQKDQRDEMEKAISSSYKNAVELSKLSFNDLYTLGDSLSYNCSYTVKDEVAELGDMKMLRVPFEDIVASINSFPLNQRNFPVEYYSYEDADEYQTTVNVTIPSGTTFTEIPKNQSFSFNGSTYSLEYVKKDDTHLTVVRKASLKKDDIAANDYPAMKNFLNNIVKAESKYIAFKEE